MLTDCDQIIKPGSITSTDVSTNLLFGLNEALGNWTCAEIVACRNLQIQLEPPIDGNKANLGSSRMVSFWFPAEPDCS